MKTLYLQCTMGAAGDMLMAALLELYPHPEDFLQQMRSLGLPGVIFQALPSEKCGIFGTRMHIQIHGHQEESRDLRQEDLPSLHDQDGDDSPALNHCHPSDHRHTHDRSHHHHHDYSHHHHHDHCHDHSHPHAKADPSPSHQHQHHLEDPADSLCPQDPLHPSPLLDKPKQEASSPGELRPYPHHPSHDDPSAGSFPALRRLICGLDLPKKVQEDAIAVYSLLAEAESRIHNSTAEEVHFHEVGALDAVADIVGVCLLLHLLRPDAILCSPIATGEGFVHAAHGILPVPAPATAALLTGMEIYSSGLQAELCTPTGAALLKYFVTAQSPLPPMKILSLGYGMGKKDFPIANCLRAFLGESTDKAHPLPSSSFMDSALLHQIPLLEAEKDLQTFLRENTPRPCRDTIAELHCNIDDMTGEELAFAAEQIWKENPLDLFFQIVQGKKGRPSFLVTCLCFLEQEHAMAAALLKWTSTRGLRRQTVKRSILISAHEKLATAYGEIRIKHSVGWGVHKTKAEYEDLSAAAKKHGVPLPQIQEEIKRMNPNLEK